MSAIHFDEATHRFSAVDASARAGSGRANQRYALPFPGYLRSCGEAAGLRRVKCHLARRRPTDVEAYYDVKDAVCDIVIAAAEAWAREVRWEPRPSDA